MPGTSRNLTLMLLPQSWDGANLIANLLLLPNGDPTAAVALSSGSELAFAQAQPRLQAALLAGLTTPPWDPSVTPAMLTTVSLGLSYSAAQSAIYASIAAQYAPTVLPPASFKQPAGVICKDLPGSYLAATGFQTPSSDTLSTGDGFLCSLASAPSQPNTTPVSTTTIQWGEILSYALRQPLIAQAMGLIYTSVSIPIDAATAAQGGWIWLQIDTSDPSNWYAQLLGQNAQAVFSYAARLPALIAAQDVFAAILFPTTSGNYISAVLDQAQYEADLYLDGFAKIVHANQPTSSDAVTNDPSQIAPGTDAGIQIGWDDEQVTTWINRQVSIAQGLAALPPPPATPIHPEVPFTVLGYRVDVRQDASQPWSSLCSASGTLSAAGVYASAYNGELCVEPTPVQNGTGDYWLPQYFAQWRGRTLVVNDPYAYLFSGGQPPAAAVPSSSEFTGTTNEVLPAVGLRYGESYQFRTRLTDLTGGGPEPDDASPTDAGITTLAFKRYLPPKKVPLTLGAVDAGGSQPLTVDRPGINYPEMVFAGAADAATLTALQALTPTQPPAGSANPSFPAPFQAAVLDPDVTTLEIIVEAQAPTHDTGTQPSLASADTPPSPGDLDDGFRVVYTWQLPFPALTTPLLPGASTPIQLTLQPTEMDQIDAPATPSSAAPTVIPVPTGRNVRLRLRGLGNADPNNTYFGNDEARTGLISDLRVRYELPNETGIIAAGSPDEQLQAYFLRDLDQSTNATILGASVVSAIAAAGGSMPLQNVRNLVNSLNPPSTTPIQLLASALELQSNGMTLAGAPGQRILFGAQSTLRATIPQDGSSITFSGMKDLLNHWIVVTRLTVDRDWTWRGIAQNGAGQIGFSFVGATAAAPDEQLPGTQSALSQLGRMSLPTVVSSLAIEQGAPDQRDQTELIFFSTIDPTVPAGDFPTPIAGYYELQATLTGAPTVPVQLWSGNIMVPIAAPPQQVPQVVSAGIAESPYLAAADYSSTTQRQRGLWIEFSAPPQDPNDAYFVRVANYGPDPLLISNPTDLASAPDTALALDPEPIRMITPDSANDDAGLGAMTELIPSSTSAVHFLVPLPGGIAPAALDLFGFWTYEIRCGHLQWSTAQARYGRPLRIAGVQHPCPPLTANVERIRREPTSGGAIQPCISATADLAQTVWNGVSLTVPDAPQTQIWFLLYTQLMRADGKAYRNLLLSRLPGVRPSQIVTDLAPANGQTQSIPVTAAFPQAAIDDILYTLGLPPNSPLSILAVELFNREALVIRDDGFSAEIAGLDSAVAQALLRTSAIQMPPAATQPASASVAEVSRMAEVAPDPLGSQLGGQRILRVSPLTPVRVIC